MYICVYVRKYVCTYTYVCICAYKFMYMYVCMCIESLPLHMYYTSICENVVAIAVVIIAVSVPGFKPDLWFESTFTLCHCCCCP